MASIPYVQTRTHSTVFGAAGTLRVCGIYLINGGVSNRQDHHEALKKLQQTQAWDNLGNNSFLENLENNEMSNTNGVRDPTFYNECRQ